MTATRKKTPAKGKTTKKKPTRATKGRTSASSKPAASKGQTKRKAPTRATSASSTKPRKTAPAAKRKQPAAESKTKGRPSAKAKGTPAVRGSSILDAAVRVLRENKKPMRCKEIMEVVLAKKYWTTRGRTPHATLYSAILREITNKGKDSRFEKVERGLFMLRKGA